MEISRNSEIDQSHTTCKRQSQASNPCLSSPPIQPLALWCSYQTSERKSWSSGERAEVEVLVGSQPASRRVETMRAEDNHWDGENQAKGRGGIKCWVFGLFLLEEEKQRRDWERTRQGGVRETQRKTFLTVKGANNVYNTDVQKKVNYLSSKRSFVLSK